MNPLVSGIVAAAPFVFADSAVFTRLVLCCVSPSELCRVVRGIVIFGNLETFEKFE